MREKAKKPPEKRRRSPYIVLAQMLIPVILLAAAFYAPQIIFRIQDGILCGRTSLDKRENMDVETLSVTYERQLSQRMKNFAEGLAEGEHFYAASQELKADQKLYEYLNSEQGLYQGFIQILMEVEWIYYSFWEQGYTVNQWKQYVIYSDDYAKGVNFILWYIELQDSEGAVLKLLADVEEGTIYAFQTENINHDAGVLINRTWTAGRPMLLWYYFAEYYEVRAAEELEKIMQEMERSLDNMYESQVIIDGYIVNPYSDEHVINEKISSKAAVMVSENAGYRMDANELHLILPYGEHSLEVLLLIDEESIPNEKIGGFYLHYRYPNITVGFRQIYELIPEFL